MTDKPNVLLICADQWRGDCMSALGHPNVRTPNLDALTPRACCFPQPFRPVHAVRPVAHEPADRPLSDEPPVGPQRHAARRAAHQHGARGAQGRATTRRCSATPTPAPDPRGRHPNDPALTAYDEGVMPGFPAPLHLPEDMGAWVAGPDRERLRLAERPRRCLPAARGFREACRPRLPLHSDRVSRRRQRDRLSDRRVPEMASGARAAGRGLRISCSSARIRR